MQLAPSTRGLCAAALAGLALLVPGRPAAAGPATDRLREFFGTVNAVLSDPATQSQPLVKVARVKALVRDIADVRGAAAMVLEREWEARTPAERDEFTRLFAELLERGLVARLAGTVSPVKGMVLTWRGESRVSDEMRVMTVVEARDGRKIAVEYRMVEQRGRWLVRDVVVEGVSTVENYRAQFKRVLRQGSYAALVAQVRAKLGEDTLMFAQAAPVAPAPPVPTVTQRVVAARPAAPASRVAARAATPPPAAKVPTRAPAVTPPPVSVKAVDPPPAQRTLPRVAQVATPAEVKTAAAKTATVETSSTVKAPAAMKTAPVKTPVTVETATTVNLPPRVAPPPPVTPPATVAPAPPIVAQPSTPVETAKPAWTTSAEVLSPISAMEITEHLLPSILVMMLGIAGVTGVVCLRRRASASTLVLERLGDRDKRLVLVHPVPRVAKVGERGGKRRVVPAPRHPARHVNDAHGA